ncbi:ABC transporter ATP-binding protein [Paenibacillus sp. P96]|uniref:ABC transporter ATP-binding protein n=1 Tax=Paenibacillus zeirhizosphaerae TaxID=2987519 RepID=A0ABT9FP52_9BACL|nr:ABC transporter ATP-binding protein [Paenibacillus sp. P96]MDP4096508.1 ABC transporter ATP-binding protein [Paenibacillus sp. P96]
MNSIIKVEDVSKIYKLYMNPSDRLKESLHPLKKSYHKEFFALNNLSFHVNNGESVGIIGKNGSGKSTLLKIITGVLSPTTGSVHVQGKISALLELGAGFNPDFSGLENIYLNGTMMGFSKEEMDAKLDDIIQFADIGDFIHQPVRTYSSGMFVRLAFAVAINVEPEILIVDEALSVGDIFFQAKCFKKFTEFKEQGKTILFVTHDMSSIMKYCDRVIVINEGVIIEEGPPGPMIDVYKKILVDMYDKNEGIQPQTLEEIKDEHGSWKDNLSINPGYTEYGNKRAEILDYAIFDHNNDLTNVVLKGKEFKIKLKIRFNEPLRDPIFAFSIKDVRGTEITGTNTMLESVDIKEAVAGKIIEVCFTQTNHLQGGDYLISLGCTCYEGNDFVVFHRLYDIMNLHVISNKNSVGFFDMNSKILISDFERNG